MTALIDWMKATPAYQAMSSVNKYLVEQSGIDPKLRIFINLRVSQLNRCSFCVAFYREELRTLGEAEPRVYMLNAWREAPFYSARERAALEWAEAITLPSNDEGSDKIYRAARAQFTAEELANLTLAVAAINSWNRLNLAFQREAAASRPPKFLTSR
jgi:AhpD family alkylhydroperoxidase